MLANSSVLALDSSALAFLAFFIYRDGDRIYEYLHSVGSKLLGDRAQKLLSLVGETITGVVYGVVGTALAQGLIAGVGFMIAGVPAAALLGLVTFFISFIPMAPPLVWLPVVAWLYWNEGLGVAAFMFVWGMFAISGIDNVIKPWLISRGAQLPFVVVFRHRRWRAWVRVYRSVYWPNIACSGVKSSSSLGASRLRPR